MKKPTMVAIHNGGNIRTGKTSHVIVETVKKPRSVKPITAPRINPLSTALAIERSTVEGTRGNIVVTYFNRQLSDTEKTAVEQAIQTHDCKDLVTGRVWRKNDILRISIKSTSVCECGCRDIRQMMREIISKL